MKTTANEVGVVETGVAGTDAAEGGVETEGAAVIVLAAAVAEAEVCYCFDLQMILYLSFPSTYL